MSHINNTLHKLFGPTYNGNTLMKEELTATWFATALLMAVMGSQFSNRDDVSSNDRNTLDVLFLSISSLILVWASLSFYNLITYFIHRLVLLIIVLSTLSSLFYVIFLASQSRI